MTLLEQAPPLAVEGLSEDYQLLAEFNGTVLAGHMTRYRVQFATWEWVRNKASLWQGHYYDPKGLPDCYQSAKVSSTPSCTFFAASFSFISRSWAITSSAFFLEALLLSWAFKNLGHRLHVFSGA